MRPNKPKCWSLEQREAYCRVRQREQAVHAAKTQTIAWLWPKSFYRWNLGEGCQCGTVFWLAGGEVTGRCFRNLTHQRFGSDHSGIHVLELSLKLPSSPWVGTFVPMEELWDMYQTVLYLPWGGARTLLYCHTTVSWLPLPCFCSLTSLLVTD